MLVPRYVDEAQDNLLIDAMRKYLGEMGYFCDADE